MRVIGLPLRVAGAGHEEQTFNGVLFHRGGFLAGSLDRRGPFLRWGSGDGGAGRGGG